MFTHSEIFPQKEKMQILTNVSNFVFFSNSHPFKYGPVDTEVFGNKMLPKYNMYMYKTLARRGGLG